MLQRIRDQLGFNSQTGSRYLKEKLNKTITTRRQPGTAKFFNNAKGKIGKQSKTD